MGGRQGAHDATATGRECKRVLAESTCCTCELLRIGRLDAQGPVQVTICTKMITVLTRYRPIVLELKKIVMTVIFPGGEFLELI